MLDPAKLEIEGLPWFASSEVLAKIGSNLAIGATLTHVMVRKRYSSGHQEIQSLSFPEY